MNIQQQPQQLPPGYGKSWTNAKVWFLVALIPYFFVALYALQLWNYANNWQEVIFNAQGVVDTILIIAAMLITSSFLVICGLIALAIAKETP